MECLWQRHNSTQLDVELWVESLWTPSTTHDADRRRVLSGTQPVSAKQVSSLFITLILLLSFDKFIFLFFCPTFRNIYPVIQSHKFANSVAILYHTRRHSTGSRRSEPPTHRRRIDNWQLSWVVSLCTSLRRNSTQLDVKLSCAAINGAWGTAFCYSSSVGKS